MFKSYITNKISSLIGEYFEEIDVNEIKTSIFQGTIELENLV